MGRRMNNHKILIIEDNKLNMKLVRELLKLEKYQIIEAENAETGIELAKAHQPDLILMDIQLPGMSGFEATKILKENTLLQNIPVIALTSYAMKGDEDKAYEAGCNGYITKPIDTQKFLEYVSKFLNGHSKKMILQTVRTKNDSKSQNTCC